MFCSHAPLNRGSYPCGKLVCARLVGDFNAKVRERIKRMSLAIKFSGYVFIDGQRARRRVIRDPLPAEIKGSIEPDCQASVFIDKIAISFQRPCTAAKRNYAGCLPIQNYLKSSCFSVAETRLPLFFD